MHRGVLLTPQEAGGSPLLSVPSSFYCISLTPIIAGEGKAVRWVRDKPESWSEAKNLYF